MRLFEFSDDDPLRVKLVSVVSQLKSSSEPITTDDLLHTLLKNDISVEKSDLYDMVKKEPLKNIIDNISGDEVTFKGQAGNPENQGPDENEKVRQQMAKKALK
jgi:hypothetical protein